MLYIKLKTVCDLLNTLRKKEFVSDMKKLYQVPNLKLAEEGLENFEEK